MQEMTTKSMQAIIEAIIAEYEEQAKTFTELGSDIIAERVIEKLGLNVQIDLIQFVDFTLYSLDFVSELQSAIEGKSPLNYFYADFNRFIWNHYDDLVKESQKHLELSWLEFLHEATSAVDDDMIDNAFFYRFKIDFTNIL